MRARLALRIGVTGHREVLPSDLLRLTEQIEEVLARLSAIVREAYQQRNDVDLSLYSDEEPLLRVISPLAEGGDQLVACQALVQDFSLQCPLPFPLEEYALDFAADPESGKRDATWDFQQLLNEASGGVLELDGDRASSEEAYEAMGRMVLRQCDVLIAVWDPAHQGGRERTGGTRQIVREAVGLEIPVLWISSGTPREPCLLHSVETLESAALPDLDLRLRRILHFSAVDPEIEEPAYQACAARQRREIQAAEEFFLERKPRRDFSRPFNWYRKAWCGGFETQKPLRQCTIWQELFAENREYMRIIKRISAHSDALAKHYGGIFRSSFLLSYLMGAGAVMLAFLGFCLGNLGLLPSAHGWVTVTFSAEMFLVAAAFVLTVVGRKKRWHQRWMDYRLLSESMRQIQILAPLGRTTPTVKVPAHLQPGDPRNGWVNWYFRAVVRQGGMLAARFDAPYLSTCKQALREAMSGQVEYHEETARQFETMARRSRWTAQSFFVFAGIACLMHLTGMDHGGHWMAVGLGFATIVLPAFGAALAAIAHHGEFERLALRSDALAGSLRRLLGGKLSTVDPLSSKVLGDIAERFSEIMLAETLDWRFAFLDKNLELPA